VDAVQKALATSAYPEGLDGSCAAKYVPEAAELWVEYELPRQEVIPTATGVFAACGWCCVQVLGSSQR
jgi:restriction system protein